MDQEEECEEWAKLKLVCFFPLEVWRSKHFQLMKGELDHARGSTLGCLWRLERHVRSSVDMELNWQALQWRDEAEAALSRCFVFNLHSKLDDKPSSKTEGSWLKREWGNGHSSNWRVEKHTERMVLLSRFSNKEAIRSWKWDYFQIYLVLMWAK